LSLARRGRRSSLMPPIVFRHVTGNAPCQEVRHRTAGRHETTPNNRPAVSIAGGRADADSIRCRWPIDKTSRETVPWRDRRALLSRGRPHKSIRKSGPHSTVPSSGELRQVATMQRSGCDQVSGRPSWVDAQSCARMSAPISPPPARKAQVGRPSPSTMLLLHLTSQSGLFRKPQRRPHDFTRTLKATQSEAVDDEDVEFRGRESILLSCFGAWRQFRGETQAVNCLYHQRVAEFGILPPRLPSRLSLSANFGWLDCSLSRIPCVKANRRISNKSSRPRFARRGGRPSRFRTGGFGAGGLKKRSFINWQPCHCLRPICSFRWAHVMPANVVVMSRGKSFQGGRMDDRKSV